MIDLLNPSLTEQEVNNYTMLLRRVVCEWPGEAARCPQLHMFVDVIRDKLACTHNTNAIRRAYDYGVLLKAKYANLEQQAQDKHAKQNAKELRKLKAAWDEVERRIKGQTIE